MLKIIYYLTPKFLHDNSNSSFVVCPNSEKSDLYRKGVHYNALRDDVVTYANFLSTNLREDDRKNYIRKNKLILSLYISWKTLRKDGNYELFFNCFELFTELRSLGISENILPEISDSFAPEIRNGLFLFYQIFERLGFIDEHSATAKLCVDDIKHSGIHFYGFELMTIHQIDLIKRISQKLEVVVSLPYGILHNLSISDWPLWLQDSGKVVKEEPEQKKREFSYYNYLQNLDQSIGVSTYFFGTPSEKNVIELRNIGLGTGESAEGVFPKLTTKKIRSILAENKSNLKYVDQKIHEELFNSIELWKNLSSVEIDYDLDDVNMLSHLVELNLPRIYTYEKKMLKKIQKASDQSLNTSLKKNCIIQADYKASNFSSSFYQDESYEMISSISPLATPKFRRTFFESEHLNALYQSDCIYVERGAEEIKKMFPQKLLEACFLNDFLEVPTYEKNKAFIKREFGPFLVKYDKKIEEITASSFETYLECPLRFYFYYVLKVNRFSEVDNFISPFLLGSLEHDLIFGSKKESDWSAEIEKWFEELKIRLDPVERKKYRLGVLEKVKRGRVFFEKIGAFSRLEESVSEVSSTGVDLKGRIDIVLELDEKTYLLDVKRSRGGLPSQKDFEKFRKPQLLFYLSRMKLKAENIGGVGYIPLDDTKKSVIWGEKTSFLSGLFNFRKFDFHSNIDAYKSFEEKKIEEISTAAQFLPKPFDEKSCDRCDFRLACPGAN